MEELDSPDYKRLIPIPFLLSQLRNKLILITHEHLDHCDPQTLPLYTNITNAIFIGPSKVRNLL